MHEIETSTGGPRRTFFGREHELHSIDRAFAEGARLVTLTGSAGTGKTRLAERFLELSRDSGGHEARWFCELSQASSADELCTLVSGELGLPRAGRDVEQSAETIGRALAGRGRGLLVLDNLEHLLEPALPLISLWHDEAPEIEFLVTSQERLRAPEERCIELGPLAEADAVTLFVERARMSAGSLGRDAAALALVQSIVRSLDGIPLAIELAAARAGSLGLSQLLRLLERRFEVLVADRGPMHRHATLRGAIDWSWGLTAADARAALATASVFRGSFSLPAFESVVGAGGEGTLDALELLSALYDKSFLRAETRAGCSGERRYSLYESIRAYARERLEAERGTERAERAHAAWFLAFGERTLAAVEGPRGIEARRALELERDNLLAVHERGLARGDREGVEWAVRAVLPLEVVYAMQGPIERFVALLDAALASSHAAALPPELVASAQLARGRMHVVQGRFGEALHDFERASELGERAGDRRALAQAWFKAGQAAAMEGARDVDAYFDRARTLIAELGDPEIERQFAADLGWVRGAQGRTEEALQACERALELSRRIGNRRAEGAALGNMGARLNDLGRPGAAREHYLQAHEILTALGDRRAVAVVETHLANVDLGRGDLASAKERLERALAVQREVGDFAWEGLIQGYLGHHALLSGKPREAASAYREAGSILPGSYRRWAGHFLATQAIAEARVGDDLAAREHLAQARSTLEAVGSSADQLALELISTVVDLVIARREGVSAVTERRAETLIRRVRARDSAAPMPDDVRFSLMVLARELDSAAASEKSNPHQLVLRSANDGSWFELGIGERVDLSRRAALRQLLAELARARREAPGTGISLDRLFDAAWPGAEIRTESRAARVYVAINTLRKLGLGNVLLRHDDGYLLDPRIAIEPGAA